MKIIFKLLEITSNIFSKSNQLKEIFITSLTDGFKLKVNIFESISNNISSTINYNGASQKIKICLIKGKLCVGVGQILITNKKQKIEIYPENHKNFTKKIILTLLCYNINSVNEKYSVEYKSPDKTKSNICINNCNTNNTSSISISSNMNHLNQKKIKTTPINKITKRNNRYFRNKSQNSLAENTQDKKYYIGLRQKNISIQDKINSNTILFSDRTKKKLSGNVSYNSLFSEIEKKSKKVFSPRVSLYSHPLYKDNTNNPKLNANHKKNQKNKSMIINNDVNKMFKFSNKIIVDKINNQIDNYIIDKSYEDELQNDDLIIYQEDKKVILVNNDINDNKFEQLLNDFLLLYNNDTIKNFHKNEIILEFHFFVEKIYELMNEYYKEYYSLFNQNKSFIKNIKFYGYQYNNLLKLDNVIKIKKSRINIQNSLNPNEENKSKYFLKDIIKLTNELEILKNINIGLINQNIKKESSKKILKDLFVNIVNKNKSSLNEKQVDKLKKINIIININEKNKNNQNKNKFYNDINKRIFNNNIYHKYKNIKKKTTLDNSINKNKNNRDKEINKLKIFENNLNKIKVKTKF